MVLSRGSFRRGLSFVILSSLALPTLSRATIVSYQFNAFAEGFSSSLSGQVPLGLIPCQVVYDTTLTPLIGPGGEANFNAGIGKPIYMSIDLGFQKFEFLSLTGGTNDVISLKNGALDSMTFLGSKPDTTNLTFKFEDATGAALSTVTTLPTLTPTMFDTHSGGWSATPGNGFRLLLPFAAGGVPFVEGAIIASSITSAPITPGVPEPACAALITLGVLALRRRL